MAADGAEIAGNGFRDELLICFSQLRWDFVYQRPQHLMARAARDRQVVFFEEPVFIDMTEPRLDVRARGNVRVATPQLPRRMDPAERVAHQRRMLYQLLRDVDRATTSLTLWYITPMALQFSKEVEADLCIYDCMDELSAFRGAPPELLALEEELFSRADLVFTGGRSLFEAKRGRHPDVHLFPSSIDHAHFAQARSIASEPLDQVMIPRPRVGYMGVIDGRMDMQLLAAIADAAPDWSIIMLGPVVKIAHEELPVRRNILWLGQKSYAELPSYLAGWDLGLLPFALNEATRYISPTKTPEYLAAGLPLISTAVRDVVEPYGTRGLVEIVSDASEAVAEGRRLMRTDRAAHRRRADAHLAGNSWDATWSSMERLMRRSLPPGFVTLDRPAHGAARV